MGDITTQNVKVDEEQEGVGDCDMGAAEATCGVTN